MIDRIESLGLRSVNGVVDITNYVLFELGHPLHAFDFKRLGGGEIVVRRAQRGETIKTIEEEEKELTGEMLVIADESDPVAIAGVMGGLESEVGKATTDVLLESAYFDPVNIRRTSGALNMNTEASHRFERGADPTVTIDALERASELILESLGGEIVSRVDVYPKKYSPEEITCRYSKIEELLGDIPELEKEYVDGLFGKLDLEPVEKDENSVTVRVPGFRKGDITREVDLIEEVARHRGYNKIGSELPESSICSSGLPDKEKTDRKIRDILTGWGITEGITYSMVNPDTERLFGVSPDCAVSLNNPLSSDLSVLKRTSYQGILQAVKTNINNGNEDLAFFELGKTFKPGDDLPREDPYLCLAGCGHVGSVRWNRKNPTEFDLFYLKGVIAKLLEILTGTGDERRLFHKHPDSGERPDYFDENKNLEIRRDEKPVGELGLFSEDVHGKMELERKVFGASLNMNYIYEVTPTVPSFEEIPKYPAVNRELAFIADGGMNYGKIRNKIEELDIEEIQNFELKEVYRGDPLEDSEKSFLLSFEIQPRDRTLTHKEVVEMEEVIVENLENNLDVKLRGTLDDV